MFPSSSLSSSSSSSSSFSQFKFRFTPTPNTTIDNPSQTVVYQPLPVHTLTFHGTYHSEGRELLTKEPGDLLMEDFSLIQKIYDQNYLWLFHQFIPQFEEEEEKKDKTQKYRILYIDISRAQRKQSFNTFFILYPFIFIFRFPEVEEEYGKKSTLLLRAKHAFNCLCPPFATSDIDLCILLDDRDTITTQNQARYYLIISSIINRVLNDYLTLGFRFQNLLFSPYPKSSSPSQAIMNISLPKANFFGQISLKELSYFIPSPRGIYDFSDSDNSAKMDRLNIFVENILFPLINTLWLDLGDHQRDIIKLPPQNWSIVEQELLTSTKQYISSLDELKELIQHLNQKQKFRLDDVDLKKFNKYFMPSIKEIYLKFSKIQ